MSESSERLAGKTIILGITGSIAAYKSPDLVSQLVKHGATVFPVLTEGGAQFVTPMSLQTMARNPVYTSLWEEEPGSRWKPGHIELADRADLLLVAPASASTIAKLSGGLADDLLGCIYLATRAPVLFAPAMNGKMWSHPATVGHVEVLEGRGHQFVPPAHGMLACGYEGEGKLAELSGIVDHVFKVLAK